MRFGSYITEQKDKIKILVLTTHKENGDEEDVYKTVGRIKEECEKRGQECYIIFAEDSYIERDKNNIPRLYNISDKEKGIILDKTNTIAFIRGSVSKIKACIDLVSQIERHEIFCINHRETIETCSDKFRTTITLADADIPVPKTSLVSNENGIKVAFEKIGNKFPVVLKTITGSKGIGVFTAQDWPGLKSTLQTIWKINEETEILIQEFIDAKFDIRVHVLGNEVIACMKRFKIKDDFRSNYSLGGKIEEYKLNDEEKNLAVRAAKAVNAIWSGVDMMIGPDGPVVIEINSSPGTEGIEKATKLNVVEKVLDYIEDKDVWTKKTIECGFIEKLKIKGIGELDAKLDTGNGSYCSIHSDSWEVDDDEVTWTRNGKEYTHKVEFEKNVVIGGLNNQTEKRPIIKLDVEFYGTIYKNINFALSNRKGLTDLLLNRRFIKKANLVVNPAKKYMLATSVIDEAIKGTGPDKITNKAIPDAKPKTTMKDIPVDNKDTKEQPVDKKESNVEDTMLVQPVLDKNEISGFVKEFDKETENQVDDMMDKLLDALDREHHCGKPKPGSFGYKAERRIALYILDALKKGERKVEKLAALVHKGWSEVVKKEYKDEIADKYNENSIEEAVTKEVKKPVKATAKSTKVTNKPQVKSDKKDLTISPSTKNWWDSHTIETQKAWVETNKTGKIAQLVNAGLLKYGEKVSGGKSGEKETKTLETDEKIKSIEASGKSPAEIETEKRMYLAEKEFASLPEEIKEKCRGQVKLYANIFKPIVLTKTKTQKKTSLVPGSKEEKNEIERQKNEILKTLNNKDLKGDVNWSIKNEKGKIKVKYKVIKNINKKIEVEEKKNRLKTDNKTYMKKNSKMFIEPEKQFFFDSTIRSNLNLHNVDVDLAERLINAKNSDAYKSIVDDFAEGDNVGAGQIASQSGELMAMIYCCLPEKDAKDLNDKINKHIYNVRGGDNKTQIAKIDKPYQFQRSWNDAGFEARTALSIALNEKFNYTGDPSKCVVGSSWDRQRTVNNLGFDYSQKEGSTDVFLKIKNPKNNKEEILEVSLKKSWKTFLLNSSLGEVSDTMGERIPKEMNPKTHTNNLNDYYINSAKIKNFTKDMKEYISNPDIIKKIKSGKQDGGYNDFLNKLISIVSKDSKLKKSAYTDLKGNIDVNKLVENITTKMNRASRKSNMLFHALRAEGKELKKSPNKESANIVEGAKNLERDFIKSWVSRINTDPDMKDVMQDIIADAIPLQGILSGNEYLFSGKYTITPKILGGIFGTNDWNQIKQDFEIETVHTGKKNEEGEEVLEYILCHKATGKNKNNIKIAKIGIRCDGVGFGATQKFELGFYDENKEDSLAYKVKQACGENNTKPKNENIIYNILNANETVKLHNKDTIQNIKLRDWFN